MEKKIGEFSHPMTEKAAKQLVETYQNNPRRHEQENILYASEFTELAGRAIEVLCKNRTNRDYWDGDDGYGHHDKCPMLTLNGLTSLSDTDAKHLREYKGHLHLNGLTSLSDVAAESLSKHRGDHLSLDGLTSLSDAAAESISKHKGHISLSGLTSLSDAAAESLTRYHDVEWSLEVPAKLKRKIKAAVAKVLTNALAKAKDAKTDDDKKKTATTAKATADKTNGEAKKKSTKRTPSSKIVTTYDPSEYEFCLDCRILGKMARSWEITDEAAIALAESGNYMWLVSLRELSDKAAAAFAASKAEHLFLDSVEELSDSAIEILSRFKGEYLSLGILDISEAQAKLLSEYSADNTHQTLILNSLSSISPEAISHLGKMKPKQKAGLELRLDGLGELSDDAASELANFGCNLTTSGCPDLSLKGLESVSPMLAKTMHKMARDCGFRLDSVKHLSFEVASSIASLKGESQIRIEGLDTMSVEVAAALAGTRREQIYLNTSPLPTEAIQILCMNKRLNLLTDTGWYGDGDEDEDEDEDEDWDEDDE